MMKIKKLPNPDKKFEMYTNKDYQNFIVGDFRKVEF